jgi:hypothetical protein
MDVLVAGRLSGGGPPFGLQCRYEDGERFRLAFWQRRRESGAARIQSLHQIAGDGRAGGGPRRDQYPVLFGIERPIPSQFAPASARGEPEPDHLPGGVAQIAANLARKVHARFGLNQQPSSGVRLDAAVINGCFAFKADTSGFRGAQSETTVHRNFGEHADGEGCPHRGLETDPSSRGAPARSCEHVGAFI